MERLKTSPPIEECLLKQVLIITPLPLLIHRLTFYALQLCFESGDIPRDSSNRFFVLRVSADSRSIDGTSFVHR